MKIVYFVCLQFDVGERCYKYYDYDQMIFDLHLGDLQYFAAMSKAIIILKEYEQ